MDQAAAKKELQELIKRQDLKNKICVDCGNPNPQWASVSFGIFMCLQCAGVHRGFGVHISFIRSVSMDTWQEDQLKRMRLGGNGPFKDFMQAYAPAEQGGYKLGMNARDLYHCWAAAQYRDKLTADIEGKPWSPSLPPPDFSSPGSGTNSPARPSSAQGLRKSRGSARNAGASSLRQDSASPAPYKDVTELWDNSGSRSSPVPVDQKAANESFFAGLGAVNAERSADLAPSQGGRYQGFGNTPTPPTSKNPSVGLSSAAAPTLSDFQENPTAALSKGWSLFSSVVAGATRVVNDSVIQPGLEKVTDPNLHASVKGYVAGAARRANTLGQTANEWGRQQLGVDVANSVGGVYDNVRERVNGPGYEGYGALASQHDAAWEQEQYNDGDDLFHDFEQAPANSNAKLTNSEVSNTPAKRADDWDEWKDF